MAIEIERKFLVRGQEWRDHASTILGVRQGYLSDSGQNSVRIRIVADHGAWITVKSAYFGVSRTEYEYAIPFDDARQMLSLCHGEILDKNRHIVHYGDAVWEVDEYFGANDGLIVAEIELASEDQTITRPAWLGEEVTGDRRYLNSMLVSLPYREWPEVK